MRMHVTSPNVLNPYLQSVTTSNFPTIQNVHMIVLNSKYKLKYINFKFWIGTLVFGFGSFQPLTFNVHRSFQP